MSVVAAKLRFGWIELSSVFPTEVEKKPKRVDDEAAALQLMLGHVIQQNHTLPASNADAASCQADGMSSVALSSSSSSSSSGSSFNSESLDLSVVPSPGSDWEKCLDLKTGRFYFANRNNSKRERQARVEVETEGVCLDLGLHLGAHKKRKVVEKEAVCSPPHSAISFQEDAHRDHLDATRSRNIKTKVGLISPLPTSLSAPLVTMGCSKCLMFLMLSQDNPRCPRCGTSSLLDLSLNKSNQGTHFSSTI